MSTEDLSQLAGQLRGEGFDAEIGHDYHPTRGVVPGLFLRSGAARLFFPTWELGLPDNQEHLIRRHFEAIIAKRPKNFETAEPQYWSEPAAQELE
jgi:hypothetical protein